MDWIGELCARARMAQEWRNERVPLPGILMPAFFQIAMNNLRNGSTVERMVWSSDCPKDVSARTLTGTMLQILDESLADRLHERQNDFLKQQNRQSAAPG